MSNRRQRGNNKKDHGRNGVPDPAEGGSKLEAGSPVLALFRSAAAELDNRHDRYERIVKLSRDITIESKRIIFLLHSVTKDSDRNITIIEAGRRLEALQNGIIKKVALELADCPLHLCNRALSPGLQEYVEAITLYGWLLKGQILQHKDLEADFNFSTTDDDGKVQSYSLVLPMSDYILGIADLTGELMRRCINVLANGDTDECKSICQFLQRLYTGFAGVGGGGYEMSRKMYTMRSSVSKAEAVVYAIQVRGGEAPPSLLLPPPAPGPPQTMLSASQKCDSDDEGYF